MLNFFLGACFSIFGLFLLSSTGNGELANNIINEGGQFFQQIYNFLFELFNSTIESVTSKE